MPKQQRTTRSHSDGPSGSRRLAIGEIIGAPHGLEPVVVPALREMAMGRWDGLTATEIQAREPSAAMPGPAPGPAGAPEVVAGPDVQVRDRAAVLVVTGGFHTIALPDGTRAPRLSPRVRPGGSHRVLAPADDVDPVLHTPEQVWLRAVDPCAYVPIDISGEFLRDSAAGRDSDQMSARDPVGVQDAARVGREVGAGVAGVARFVGDGAPGVAVVVPDHPETRRHKGFHLRLPHAPVRDADVYQGEYQQQRESAAAGDERRREAVPAERFRQVRVEGHHPKYRGVAIDRG